MKRIVFVCTHPQQYSGYAKVTYNILKNLSLENYEMNVYAIQKSDNVQNDFRNDLDENINIYDAGKQENGFNFSGLCEYVNTVRADTVVIYNDAYVISMYLIQLLKCRKMPKVVVYFDQVYPYTNTKYIENFNKYIDHMIVFSEGWKDTIVEQGLTVPVSVMKHGISDAIKQIPKTEACERLGLDHKGLYLLNMNTNQVRKRYDIFLMGLAKYYAQNPDSELKVVIPYMEYGAFNIDEILKVELKRHNCDLKVEDIIIYIKSGQYDEDINVLYNACDIGINTCEGEGFGLCNIEHGSVNKPQIVSNVGYFKEVEEFYKLETVGEYYVDNNRDGIGGKASIVSVDSVVNGIEYFVNNPKNRTYEMKDSDLKWDLSPLELQLK